MIQSHQVRNHGLLILDDQPQELKQLFALLSTDRSLASLLEQELGDLDGENVALVFIAHIVQQKHQEVEKVDQDLHVLLIRNLDDKPSDSLLATLLQEDR